MLALLLMVALLGFAGPAGAAAGALAAAAAVFCGAVMPDLSPLQLVLIDAVIIAIPASGWLAGELAGSVIDVRSKEDLLGPAALCGAFVLALGSGALPGFVEAALHAVRGASSAGMQLGFLCALAGAAFFCASAVAITLAVSVLLVELPARWVLSAARSPFRVSFGSLRMLVVLAVAGLSVNLSVGLFAHELWPATIAAALGK